MDATLYSRCRAARKAHTLTPELMAELLDACGRAALAALWRLPENATAMPDINHTGLEYYIKEAKRHQDHLARSGAQASRLMAALRNAS